MFPFSTPGEMMRLSLRTTMMLGQAQLVIGMRLMGMAGLWRVTPSETRRMVAEKVAAAQAGGAAGVRAAARGGSAAKVAEAMVAPAARKTRSNARRLAARGPRQPG